MIQAVNLKERFPDRPELLINSPPKYIPHTVKIFFFFNGILLLETNGISKYSLLNM